MAGGGSVDRSEARRGREPHRTPQQRTSRQHGPWSGGSYLKQSSPAARPITRLTMWTLWQDLRYSARLLLKHPGFTLTAIGVLTLGIGVNAGIFGIINGLMLRPLAGADAPGEVVGIYSKDRTTRARLSRVFVSRIRRRARRRRTVRDTSPPTTSRSPASPRTAPRARSIIDIVSDKLFRGARRAAGPRPRLHHRRGAAGHGGAAGDHQLHAVGTRRVRSATS